MGILGEKLIQFKRYFFPVVVFQNSTQYWRDRYKIGRDSGSGSYNFLARFKADIINNFVEKEAILSVAEYGCGDGNQLQYFKFHDYVGYDVSSVVIDKCKSKFANDSAKRFFLLSEHLEIKKVDLTLSLDVIYHLVEDEIFETYMAILFDSSRKFVIIYSSNFESNYLHGSHERPRIFTRWVEKNRPEFKLQEFIPNKYAYDKGKKSTTSQADFFIYKLTS